MNLIAKCVKKIDITSPQSNPAKKHKNPQKHNTTTTKLQRKRGVQKIMTPHSNNIKKWAIWAPLIVSKHLAILQQNARRPSLKKNSKRSLKTQQNSYGFNTWNVCTDTKKATTKIHQIQHPNSKCEPPNIKANTCTIKRTKRWQLVQKNAKKMWRKV